MVPCSRRRVLHGVAAAGALSLGVSATTADGPRWKRTYGSSDYQVQAVVAGHDGGVLLVGRTGSSNADTAWLAEVGPGGAERWTTTLDRAGFPRFEDGVATDDGYLLAGTAGDGGDTPWVVAVDATGGKTREWTGRAPALPTAVTRVGDAYAVSGLHGTRARTDEPTRAWIRVVDAAGDERWDATYDATHASVVRPRDDGYVTAGTTRPGEGGDDRQAWLAFLDPDGDVHDRRDFGGAAAESANALLRAGDGYAYAGTTASPAGDRGRHGFLARTDAAGRVVWRRTYGVQDVAGVQRRGDGYVLAGEPHADGGRDPEKPVVYLDRWGRAATTRTVTVPTGAPVDLARLGKAALALGGWSDQGPWLAALPRTP